LRRMARRALRGRALEDGLAARLLVRERMRSSRWGHEALPQERTEVRRERDLQCRVVVAALPTVEAEARDEPRGKIGALAVPAIGPLRLHAAGEHRRLASVAEPALAVRVHVAPARLDGREIGARKKIRERAAGVFEGDLVPRVAVVSPFGVAGRAGEPAAQ